MTRPFFITATGTDIGKTFATAVLCHQLTAQGKQVTALKPVLSGPPDDAHIILESLGREPTEEAIHAISPWRFTAPLSPHLAAAKEGRELSIEDITAFCRAHEQGDILLVEGAGGVMTPLTERETFLDLMAELRYPALLVTGTYVGALSHTLTAAAALQTRGVPLRAIVISESPQSAATLDETKASLQAFAKPQTSVYAIPRIHAPAPWRSAPPLSELCTS